MSTAINLPAGTIPIAAEDEARAGLYALLSRLLAAPPDAPLLQSIGAAELWVDDGGNPLAAAWNQLVLASQTMDAEVAAQEYTELFLGVGRAECNLHSAYWLREPSLERPLVGVRADLAALGLARQGGSTVYEDHLAALCETMRILIVGAGDHPPAPVFTQQTFFERRIQPWAFECCAVIQQSPVANYYGHVAEFGKLFLAVERESFAIE